MSFAGRLIMNRWLTGPEAPALHLLWHDGDDAGALRRATKPKKMSMLRNEQGGTCL